MSGNIWAVLNNVEEDGKLKPKKKPVNKAKPAANQKPAVGPNGKPQLTAKAARAFQQPKQQPKKKPQPAAAAPAAAAKSPAPTAAKSSPAASAGKKGAAPQAKPQPPAMVVKPAAAAPVIQATPSAQSSPKVQSFQRALSQVLNGQAAFFQVSLGRSSEVGVLQANPYRVVGDLVKSPQFITNLGLALKKDAGQFAKKDARTKIQGRVNRVGVAHHLLSLLSGYSPIDQSKTDDEATRLVTGFLEAVWNLPPPAEPVKRIEPSRVEEASEEDEMIGSAGNVKRDAVTLFDFIAPAKVKGGKKKGAAKPAQQAQAGKGKEKVDAAPAPAAAVPVAAAQPAAAAAAPAAAAQPAKPAVEGKKDDPTSWRTDLVDSARQLAKRIPGNIQCVRVEPTFLYTAPEVKASGKQQPYFFRDEGCDHCYALWEDGKGDIYFLITTGGVSA
jgi:hypothetical protein